MEDEEDGHREMGRKSDVEQQRPSHALRVSHAGVQQRQQDVVQ